MSTWTSHQAGLLPFNLLARPINRTNIRLQPPENGISNAYRRVKK
ncbi:Uncharacterised protein [Sphingobacterium thalpophilum]|uniref:Uncharacterized protein n=1 Tax=Sphingobacterium thalpophilum TaxID=259 RepID=A0A4U9V6K4_9SPHI|nr:Uncharacterised protein [Sphingobacterium thalpophilum]